MLRIRLGALVGTVVICLGLAFAVPSAATATPVQASTSSAVVDAAPVQDAAGQVVIVAKASKCKSTDHAGVGFALPWGPYDYWTIGKCKAKTWNSAIAPLGAAATAGYLCTRLEKVPGVGWIGTAVCLAWVAIKAGGIKKTFSTAVNKAGYCPQLRFWVANQVLTHASKVVKCHYPK